MDSLQYTQTINGSFFSLCTYIPNLSLSILLCFTDENCCHCKLYGLVWNVLHLDISTHYTYTYKNSCSCSRPQFAKDERYGAMQLPYDIMWMMEQVVQCILCHLVPYYICHILSNVHFDIFISVRSHFTIFQSVPVFHSNEYNEFFSRKWSQALITSTATMSVAANSHIILHMLFKACLNKITADSDECHRLNFF